MAAGTEAGRASQAGLLSWTEGEGGLDCTQPGPKEPRPGEEGPAQEFLVPLLSW